MKKVFSGLIYCNMSFYKASGVGFYTHNFYTLLLKSSEKHFAIYQNVRH